MKRLYDYLNALPVITVAGDFTNQEITSIEYDSRKVQRDSIFVAIKGFNLDGTRFIGDAIAKGAYALVYDDPNAYPETIFKQSRLAGILVPDARKALAKLSTIHYDNPSEKLSVYAVTGTKGKTTTTYLLRSILQKAGIKTGIIGTIANFIDDVKVEATHTTPEAPDLNKLFSDMVAAGCKAAIMEVSSHSLALSRVAGVKFAGAIFTNLTSEHMDFHKDMDDYAAAKKELFTMLDDDAVAVFNSESDYSEFMASDCKAKKIWYGKSDKADYKIIAPAINLDSTKMEVVKGKETFDLQTPLIGEFNIYNATAALALMDAVGVDKKAIDAGISELPQVPGRLERINKENKIVFVDYSHSSDSLEQALLNLKGLADKENRPIYTVFGCGGNRDTTKRPVMGGIAAKYSSKVVVTSDNPRDEDPNEIIKQIVAGISTDNFTVIENREIAIKTAIEESDANAIILIAGKGHEEYQIIKGVKSHFSDKETAIKYL